MKKHLLNISLLAIAISITSCSKDEPVATPVVPIPTITDADLEADIKNDLALNESTDAAFSVFQNSFAGRGTEVTPTVQQNGNCTVEPVTNANDTYNNETYISATYNYGTAGCTNEKGATIKGMLKFYYKKDHPVIFQFTNYSVNNIVTNGTVEILKTNSSIKNTQNVTLTVPAIGEFKREGTITRLYTQGYDTKNDYTDDIFETTGSWKTTFPNKTTNVVTITKKLVTEMACTIKKHKSGTISFVRNLNTGSVDFGNDSCSAKWTITRNGKTFEIERK